MTVTATIFGHAVVWDEPAQIWRWQDTNEPAHGWGGEPRRCPECDELPTAEGDDPCIGHIPGVYSACCGHGIEAGQILWVHAHGSNLRRARRERGLSLRDVAPVIGMSISYMSDLERGIKADPSLAVARKLADFYGMTLDDLFPEEASND